MVDHINRLEQIFMEAGIKFTRLKGEQTFEFLMFDYQPKRSNPALKDKSGWSWPGPRARWCTKHLKTRVINKYLGALRSQYNMIQISMMAALPSDLRAVMQSVTKYTDNTGGGSDNASYVTATKDYLFLLAEFEAFGTRYGANSAEQNYQLQYDYYKAGNSRVAYNHSAVSTAVWWWLRSPYFNFRQLFPPCQYGRK